MVQISVGGFRKCANQLSIEVTVGGNIKPVYIVPEKAFVMHVISDQQYISEAIEYTKRKNEVLRTVNVFFENRAVGDALQEPRNYTLLKVWTN